MKRLVDWLINLNRGERIGLSILVMLPGLFGLTLLCTGDPAAHKLVFLFLSIVTLIIWLPGATKNEGRASKGVTICLFALMLLSVVTVFRVELGIGARNCGLLCCDAIVPHAH